MKDLRKSKPNILVSDEEFASIRDGAHTYTMPLNEKNLRFLPKAYADATGTILIFPKKECPREFSFRSKRSRGSCTREVVNVMAYKMEDGSEIIKIHLK
jgi:hypothetical protein